MMKPKKQRRVAAGGSAKDSVRHALPKLRLVTCEEDDGESSTDVSCDGPSPAVTLPSHVPSLTPSITDSYQILPEIAGVGIAGEVRRCLHLSTSAASRRGEGGDDGLRAVKTIDKGRVRRKDRLRREVAFLREADHPNIVSLHDVYEDERDVHIVTELCRGGELFDGIAEEARRGRATRALSETAPLCFREDDAARVLRALLSAVAYLHARDIVHRDIKPENVLFADDDGVGREVKLVDFGLAVRHPPGRRPLGALVGTAYYVAPEVLAGEYGRACDLWSVGVVAYTLLSGRPPFNGPTNDAIFDKIRGGQYRMGDCPRWRGVSEPARAFVRGLLATDPERHWTADTALEHPWLNRGTVEDVATGLSP